MNTKQWGKLVIKLLQVVQDCQDVRDEGDADEEIETLCANSNEIVNQARALAKGKRTPPSRSDSVLLKGLFDELIDLIDNQNIAAVQRCVANMCIVVSPNAFEDARPPAQVIDARLCEQKYNEIMAHGSEELIQDGLKSMETPRTGADGSVRRLFNQ